MCFSACYRGQKFFLLYHHLQKSTKCYSPVPEMLSKQCGGKAVVKGYVDIKHYKTQRRGPATLFGFLFKRNGFRMYYW